jgi:hypothetical protein
MLKSNLGKIIRSEAGWSEKGKKKGPGIEVPGP